MLVMRQTVEFVGKRINVRGERLEGAVNKLEDFKVLKKYLRDILSARESII